MSCDQCGGGNDNDNDNDGDGDNDNDGDDDDDDGDDEGDNDKDVCKNDPNFPLTRTTNRQRIASGSVRKSENAATRNIRTAN